MPSEATTTVKLTYLEFNGWVWELDGGFRILVDPILDGNLDFGIPWLFDAAKKTLKNSDGLDLAGVDLLLITQSLDDHCHLRTLTRISAATPNLPVVTTPNARPIVSALPFTNVTYIEPGESTTVGGSTIEVLATAGPVLGPPWQRPENGYILTTTKGQQKHSLYYEPHCVYDAGFLRDRGLRADVLITPVVRQLLPANFTLVSGQEDAVDLAKQLRPSYVVPMSNGEFDAKGLLTAILTTQGTIEAFKALLREALPEVQVMEPTPGVPLNINLSHNTTSSSA
jgi:L-ascorbate metabolism protein UlaG (beta-lactamase superfamily)